MKKPFSFIPLDATVWDEMIEQRILPRLWQVDYTLWKPEPTEISNRMGWLYSPQVMTGMVPRIQALVEQIRKEGYTQALLLGMGGSSLAPDLFRRVFPQQPSDLTLSVLDSTDPDAVLAQQKRIDPSRCLFIVSTKSGTTEETVSFFKYFYNWVVDNVGADHASQHFIAITDPGSKLASLAQAFRFRAVFLNDPNIGGRYSALSCFGLLPAALAGIDISLLLERAHTMAVACGPDVPLVENPAAQLGAILGEMAISGRDKVTLVLSPSIASFADWVEQLIAESTGKEGMGILPVVGEHLGTPSAYGADRLFVHICLEDDQPTAAALKLLEEAGAPVIRLHLADRYDLGGQFFLWEMATAIASHWLHVNPFDQPNVESAKVRARQMMAAYKSTGQLPGEAALLTEGSVTVFGSPPATLPPTTAAGALQAFLSQSQPGDYLAIQAFVQPTPQTDAALQALRLWLRDHYRLATTIGYGPRFLHSTGQLHKGDRGNGLFIQITSQLEHDAPIPDEAGRTGASVSFGVLIAAQALGDRQAMLDAGRRVIRLHLADNIPANLERIRRDLDELAC